MLLSGKKLGVTHFQVRAASCSLSPLLDELNPGLGYFIFLPMTQWLIKYVSGWECRWE